MDSTGQKLLNLLFNPGETVCVSPNKFAFHSILLESFTGQIALVSPNPDIPTKYCDSSELILCSINPILGFRNDSNVKAYRSFLLEIDSGSIKDQLGYLAKLKIPFSCQVFSGNRSIHTVITLDEDLPDLKTYRLIYQWLLKIVTFADPNCKNPSRSVRIPGAYREPGKKQRLVSMKGRISHKELFDWLNQYEHLRPQVKKQRKVLTEGADFSRLSPWARYNLTNGITFKNGRNQTWFGLAVDCFMAGFTLEQVVELLSSRFVEEPDFKEKELLTSINSAEKYVLEGKNA